MYKLTCIMCPVGCLLEAELEEGKLALKGNGCKRGVIYAQNELSDPRRMVTSAVAVKGGVLPLVPVKTQKPVPKALINEVLLQIKTAQTKAPVRIGQVLVENVAQTGIDVVATRNIDT